MKLPQTEVKFYPEVKSQTGLSLLRASCKRTLNKEHVFMRPKENSNRFEMSFRLRSNIHGGFTGQLFKQ